MHKSFSTTRQDTFATGLARVDTRGNIVRGNIALPIVQGSTNGHSSSDKPHDDSGVYSQSSGSKGETPSAEGSTVTLGQDRLHSVNSDPTSANFVNGRETSGPTGRDPSADGAYPSSAQNKDKESTSTNAQGESVQIPNGIPVSSVRHYRKASPAEVDRHPAGGFVNYVENQEASLKGEREQGSGGTADHRGSPNTSAQPPGEHRPESTQSEATPRTLGLALVPYKDPSEETGEETKPVDSSRYVDHSKLSPRGVTTHRKKGPSSLHSESAGVGRFRQVRQHSPDELLDGQRTPTDTAHILNYYEIPGGKNAVHYNIPREVSSSPQRFPKEEQNPGGKELKSSPKTTDAKREGKESGPSPKPKAQKQANTILKTKRASQIPVKGHASAAPRNAPSEKEDKGNQQAARNAALARFRARRSERNQEGSDSEGETDHSKGQETDSSKGRETDHSKGRETDNIKGSETQNSKGPEAEHQPEDRLQPKEPRQLQRQSSLNTVEERSTDGHSTPGESASEGVCPPSEGQAHTPSQGQQHPVSQTQSQQQHSVPQTQPQQQHSVKQPPPKPQHLVAQPQPKQQHSVTQPPPPPQQKPVPHPSPQQEHPVSQPLPQPLLQKTQSPAPQNKTSSNPPKEKTQPSSEPQKQGISSPSLQQNQTSSHPHNPQRQPQATPSTLTVHQPRPPSTPPPTKPHHQQQQLPRERQTPDAKPDQKSQTTTPAQQPAAVKQEPDPAEVKPQKDLPTPKPDPQQTPEQNQQNQLLTRTPEHQQPTPQQEHQQTTEQPIQKQEYIPLTHKQGVSPLTQQILEQHLPKQSETFPQPAATTQPQQQGRDEKSTSYQQLSHPRPQDSIATEPSTNFAPEIVSRPGYRQQDHEQKTPYIQPDLLAILAREASYSAPPQDHLLPTPQASPVKGRQCEGRETQARSEYCFQRPKDRVSSVSPHKPENLKENGPGEGISTAGGGGGVAPASQDPKGTGNPKRHTPVKTFTANQHVCGDGGTTTGRRWGGGDRLSEVTLERDQLLRNEKTYKQRILQLEDEVKSVVRQSQDLSSENKQLRMKLDAYETKAYGGSLELKELRREKQDLVAMVAKTTGEKQEADAENERLRTRLAEMDSKSKQWDALYVENNKLKTKQAELEKKIGDLEKEKQDMKNQVKTAENSQRDKVVAVENENKKLQADIINLQTRNSTLEKKVQRMETENKELSEHLDKKREELDEMMRAMKAETNIDMELKETKTELEFTRNKMEDYKKEVNEVKHRYEVLEKETDNAKNALRLKESEMKGLKANSEEKDTQIGELKRQVDAAKRNAKRLEDDLEDIKQVEKDTVNMKARIRSLKNEIEDSLASNHKLKQERTEARMETDRLNRELAVMTENVEEAKRYIKKLEGERAGRDKVEDELKTHKKREHDLEGQLLDANSRNESLRLKLREMDEERQELLKTGGGVADEVHAVNKRLQEDNQKLRQLLVERNMEITQRQSERNQIMERVDNLERKQQDSDIKVQQLKGWVEGVQPYTGLPDPPLHQPKAYNPGLTLPPVASPTGRPPVGEKGREGQEGRRRKPSSGCNSDSTS